MFPSIQTLCFFFRGDPETDGFVDQLEHDKSSAKCPNEAGSNSQHLYADDLGRGPAYIEDAGRKGSPCAIDPVNRDGADRIIHFNSIEEDH